jgi:predicted PurR-regulated permease PerM
VFGAVFGFLGLALATPLTAAATVPIRHWFGIEKGGLLTEEIDEK